MKIHSNVTVIISINFRSNDKELTEPHPASEKPRLFTYAGRTKAGVKAVLQEARKNATSVEFQALLEASANMPTNSMAYRGCTVLNASSDFEEVQVKLVLFNLKY